MGVDACSAAPAGRQRSRAGVGVLTDGSAERDAKKDSERVGAFSHFNNSKNHIYLFPRSSPTGSRPGDYVSGGIHRGIYSNPILRSR